MFKPLKDFITFIQKNTSNLNVGEEIITTDEMNEINDSVIPTHINEMDDAKVSVENNGVLAQHINPASDFDEDDIELQIKSSIMIKKPSPQSTRPPTPTLAIVATSSFKSPKADYNHNNQPKLQHILPEEDDELADFKNDPMQNSAEDYCSAGSETDDLPLHSADEGGDELATEDEDALEERSYAEEEDTKKIFVAVDADLNSSIASSNNEDPLAIDIPALATDAEIIVNPLDSSTNDEKIEVASNGEIIWYETNGMKNEKNIQKSDKTDSEANVQISPPQRRQGGELNEETERNDNSDSGLGTETSSLLLQTTIENSITESTSAYTEDQCNRSFERANSLCEVDSRKTIVCSNSSSVNRLVIATTAPSNNVEQQLHTAAPILVTAKTEITTVIRPCTPAARKPLRSNLKRRLCDVDTSLDEESAIGSNRLADQDTFLPKKQKRSITFDAVQVYYFPRQQGFGCVPSAGGCTLGMGPQHIGSKRLTLAEHAAELRRAHRLQLQEINPRGSSSEDTDESEEDYLSEGSGSDLEADSNGFLQPVPPKQRRALLKAAGVRKIDTSEKIDCRNIRNSREVCGCTCRDFCDPETCTCSRAGIKCQVDRAMFPCGCSRDACGNTTGRVEFNPARVRTHFIHTIMRLDMENRQQQQPGGTVNYDTTTGLMLPLASNNGVAAAANFYNSIQPQSNYSSGYASPAYTTDTTGVNYLQQSSLLYSSHHHNETITSNGSEQYHGLDNIDGGNIYASNTTPSYGEILTNYATSPLQAITSATMSSPYNHNTQSINFPTSSSYISYQQQHQQQHHTTTTYLAQSSQLTNDTNSILHSAYSSCAEPSRPAFGTATTCSSSSSSSISSDTNFINLNAPRASSSRLSQINDLLQHNRNTTAALVAVSTNDFSPTISSVAQNSIETPPITESQRSSFLFDTDLAMSTVSNKVPPTLISPAPQSKPPPAVENVCNFIGSSVDGNSTGCNYPI